MDTKSSETTECPMKADVLSAECASRETLTHVTSRWGILCLFVLRDGTHRFSEMRRRVGGISERMLALTLKNLEADGFVRRVTYPVVPPHVEYSLTDSGTDLSARVHDLIHWLEDHVDAQAARKSDELGDGPTPKAGTGSPP